MTTAPTSVNPFELWLKKGLPVIREGKTIYYRKVILRTVTLADEREAVRLAERLVYVQGQPKLLVSDADFKVALTMRHIQRLECDGLTIELGEINLDTIGKLTPLDWGAIEQRVFLVELGEQLAHGEITQAQYDQVVLGEQTPAAAPQPVGPAADAGALGAAPESGPAVLADFSGDGAAGSPAHVG